MFKVHAGSVEEYFFFDPGREDDLRALDALIRASAPTLSRSGSCPGPRAASPA